MSFQNTTSNNTLPTQQQAGGHAGVHDKLNQIKNDAHMPTNQSMLNQLDKASYTLNQTQASDKGQLLGPSNQRVVQDVQNILQDERNIISRKNEGDALQRVINDAKVLGHKLGSKVEGSDTSMIKSLINDWKHIFSSVTGGDEAKDLANTGNSLFKGLADTEEFLDLVSELINLVKLLIARADSAITKDTSKQSEHKNEWDREGEVIMEKVRATLDTLAANDLWTHLVTQGRSFAQKTTQEIRGALPEAQAQAQQALQQAAPQGNIWEALDSREMHTFTEDLKQFLQRLVGPEHSVEPLFEYTKAALRDIKNDRELHKAIHLTEDTLHNVAVNADQAIHDAQDSTANHAANPAYNAMNQHHTTMNVPSLEKTSEPHNVDMQQVAGETEEQLKTVANHLQAALNNIKHNQNLHRAREEAHILREAFLNDPDNRQLISDARQLWHDLHSPSGGLDPTLLIGLREAVVPMFLDHFNNVPIPPIHSTVSMLGKMAFTIEGITISIPQILPENLYLRFEYEMDTTIRSLDVTQQRLYMHIELRDIHVHLRNVAWAYQRLSAPRKADSGHLDLDTLGDGITTKLKVQIRSDHTVDVKEAHVNVQRFSTKFTDSKHNKLYQGLSHVFAHQIKKNIQKSVEAKLKQMGAEFGGKLMTTLANVQQKSTAMFGTAMTKKAQIFEMLSNKRGQHQPKEGGGMKARAQHVRENSLFQSAVHKAAGSATHALDDQQRKVDEKKAEAHERKEEKERMESAAVDYLAQQQSGLAPTLPATNRPASPPVPAMTFIPESNISTAPITQNHGLTHVNPTSIDTRPMTDASTHSVDPEIQRVLAEKLNLTQHN